MITIKRATEEDLKEILALQYIAYQSEAELFQSTDIPPLKQTIGEVLEEFHKGIILKAMDENGSIVGSVRAYSENGTAHIGKLMVHPEMQNRGLGARLLSEIEQQYPNQRYELFTSTKHPQYRTVPETWIHDFESRNCYRGIAVCVSGKVES